MSSVFIGSARNRTRSISVCGALPAHESKDIISIYEDTTLDTGTRGEKGRERRVRRARGARAAHGVHALVTPSIWRAEVALAFNRLATEVPERLVHAVAATAPDPLDVSALVVARQAARPVAVLDFGVVGMAPGTVEEWGWRERREGC